LGKAPLGEIRLESPPNHALVELPGKIFDIPVATEASHRPAKPIRLGRGEAGTLDRNPHRLLLKQWNAQRLAEDRFKLWFRKTDRLDAVAPAQVRMV
jgi:hypothetical protein